MLGTCQEQAAWLHSACDLHHPTQALLQLLYFNRVAAYKLLLEFSGSKHLQSVRFIPTPGKTGGVHVLGWQE